MSINLTSLWMILTLGLVILKFTKYIFTASTSIVVSIVSSMPYLFASSEDSEIEENARLK
jgi:hypothetical protein